MNKKYFIAIVLPEPILSQVEEIKKSIFAEFNVKGALRSPAHITLHRPFEWKEEKEELLITKLREFKFSSEFQIILHGFNVFEPRVVYVDLVKENKLDELHKALKKYAQIHLKLLNEVNDMRGFHPHITIAFRDLKKSNFNLIWNEYKTKPFNAEFAHSGFSLLKLDKVWKEIAFFAQKKGDN